MNILALDLSLTATGYAHSDGRVGIIQSKFRGTARLHEIRQRVLELAEGSDVVVLEGYSFSSRTNREVLGELGGVVRLALWDAGIPFVVLQPSTLKKLATGRGNAGKEEVLAAAIRRLGYAGANNNEADALWLLEAARQAYGSGADLPKAHTAALAKVEWPALRRAA